MSGYSDDEVLRSGSLPPGYSYIQKPFAAEDLAHRLRALIERP